MISDEVKKSISEWAKKTDSKDADTLKLLAIKYTEENQIDWDTQSGKAKVISYVEEISYGKTRQSVDYHEEWKDHQPDYRPFELSKEGYKSKIKKSNFPFEINELHREFEDKVYKSPYLANFIAQGRIKLIRKAKILAFLYKNKKSN